MPHEQNHKNTKKKYGILLTQLEQIYENRIRTELREPNNKWSCSIVYLFQVFNKPQ